MAMAEALATVVKRLVAQLEIDDLKLLCLCSLFPEDYEISREDLTRLAATELESVGSIEEKRILVEASSDTLIAKPLLCKPGGEGGRKVKMNSMARLIALKRLAVPVNFFAGIYIDESKGFPANDVLASCTAISILKKQNKELPSGLIYQKLRTLLVRGQDWNSISNNVFEGLVNLRALFLEECELLNDVSSLRYSKQLQILSFRGSSITQLPDGINEMQDLKMLDVSNCRHLVKIPHGLLKNLLNLEELYTHGSLHNLFGEEMGKASLSELQCLTHLNILSLEVSKENLPEGFVLSKLEMHGTTRSVMLLFNSSRGPSGSSDILRIENADSTWLNAWGNWELVRLAEIKCVSEGPEPVVPFANLTDVSIVQCAKLTYVFSQSLARSLIQLQKLKIEDCYVLEHIIKEEDGNLSSSDQNQPPCFVKLERLEICGSFNLKYIMSVGIARRLEKLEYLKESRNYGLKQIFGPDEEEGSSGDIVLPRLTELQYDESDHINRISCPSLRELEVGRCYGTDFDRVVNGKQLERLKLSYTPDAWHSVLPMLVNQQPFALKHIHLEYVQELYQMFHLEGLGNKEPHSIISIESLELGSVCDLKNIWSGNIYTPNLTYLEITSCANLRYIFSPTLAKNLSLLKVLKISQCETLVGIIADIHGDSDRAKATSFPNLAQISISKCKKLKYIFPASVVRAGLLKMRSLELRSNHELEGVFEGKKEVDDEKIVMLPLITELILYDMPVLKSFSPVGYHFIMPSLNGIRVNRCDKVATSFAVASDGSVHVESKDLNVDKKEDLPSYLPDESSSSRS